MEQYLDLLRDIKDNGTKKTDRTGVGTISVFGRQMRFDLNKGFPAVTTKKLFMKGVIYELLWFLRGDSNIKYLVDNGVGIWNEWPYRAYLKKQNLPIPTPNGEEWNVGIKEFIEKIKTDAEFAKEHGDLGPVYGRQWRCWPGENNVCIDQIANAIHTLITSPDSRRIIVSAWNVREVEEMAKSGLPPCHSLFQLYVADNKLSCQLYQRSADTFLGVPFNIASYALLTMMIAQVVGLGVGEFIHTLGDTHIYLNHLDQVDLQLSREPRPLPKMWINPEVKSIDDFKFEDFRLENYDPHPTISAPIAV